MLRGTGVSEGCGIGKALIIQHRSLDYSGVVFGGAQQEKERLRAAINAFMQKTEQLRDRLQASAGEKEAAILDGHMEMLRDPFMLSQMEEMIDGGATAEAAADGVCNQFIAMFSGMDDELTRQRASDIADVREDLLGIMLGAEQVDLGAIEPGTVLVAHDFTPSMTGKMNREHVAAIVAEVGGMTSHSAILARAMGIPAVLSVSGAVEALHTGQCVAVDGFRGTVLPEPTPEQTAEFKRRQREYLAEREALSRYCNLPTVTKNGVKKAVYGNIGKPEDVQAVVQNGGEGIGLFRTEFLFMDRMSRPTEAEQFEAYATVAKAMNGREVIIRTLDIGGDKEIPYLEIEKEDNPFLGHRAIRYCLDHPDLFCDQIRAILRAAKFGDLKLMLPLITCKEEILAAKKLIEQCLRELSETGKTTLPVYDFSAEKRSDKAEPIDLQGGVCLVEGIHALNPELTGLVPAEDVYRIYAGLREEYAIDGRRVINTQDIRLCRRTLRDAAARGRSPEKTLAMWDRVLDGETRYIKGFKTTADFLLDTSFTYELGLISRLLGIVRRQFTLEGHNAELWDETARRFEHVVPLDLELLPADSMLREFYGSAVK